MASCVQKVILDVAVHNAIPILCIVDFAETVNGCPQVEASRDTIASSPTCLDHRRKPPNINLIRMIRTELDIGEKAMTKFKMYLILLIVVMLSGNLNSQHVLS